MELGVGERGSRGYAYLRRPSRGVGAALAAKSACVPLSPGFGVQLRRGLVHNAPITSVARTPAGETAERRADEPYKAMPKQCGCVVLRKRMASPLDRTAAAALRPEP